MDSKNNIDQLFREKLFSQEVTPSAMAWDQVNQKINKKKPVMIYWAAASISAILFISVFIWTKKESSQKIAVNEIDHPALVDTNWLTIPKKNSVNDIQLGTYASTNTAPSTRSLILQVDQLDTEFIALNLMVLDSKRPSVALIWPALDMVKIKKYKPENRPTIKITYIASNQEASDTVKAKAINKFWSVAQSLSTTTVLADLRDAKNNLFVKNQP
jgi:hypothetical protein